MGSTIHHTSCPLCSAASIEKTIRAKDYTVSGEQFDIFHCSNCMGQFTQDIPDAASIGKYYQSENYISHSNTSKGLINRVYQSVRNRSNVQKRKLIQHVTGLQQGNLLDVGSGTGFFVSEMKKERWDVTALEPDDGARKTAAEINQVELRPQDDLFLLPHSHYDVITLWHVLEHVHDLLSYLKQFRHLLKETGRLFIAVPNYTSYDAKVYKRFWAGYDVPRHLYHFSPHSMKMLLRKEGFTVTELKPMWYDSFYVSLLSSKYKNGKTNWFGAMFTGLRSNMHAMRNVERCSSVIYIIRK